MYKTKLTTCFLLSILILMAFQETSNINIAQASAQIQPSKTESKKNKVKMVESNLYHFKDNKGNINEQIEPSGIIGIDDKGEYFLVIDDKSGDGSGEELENIKIVKQNGEIVDKLRLAAAGKKPKWEGLAKDGEDFYVIGSHAGKDADQIKKRSSLYQFRLEKTTDGKFKIAENENKPIKIDITESLKKIEVNGSKIYDENPSTNTLQKAKIEGLAIKNIAGKKNLIIGLREPESLVRLYSAELPAQVTENAKLTLIPYFSFNAGKTSDGEQFKLSSIEYVAEMKGFIVLASSETTKVVPNTDGLPIFHGNGIWFISDKKIAKAKIVEGFKFIETTKISEFQKENKSEGICALPNNHPKKFKFAIVYDNDTKDMRDAAANPLPIGKMQIVELTTD